MVYSSDIVSAKVTEICNEFVKTYENIEQIVAEFDENDKHCWFWSKPDILWFDRHRLRQLLTYIKEHSLRNFTVELYKTWDGGRGKTLGEMTLGGPPKPNKNDLAIVVVKPVVRTDFWIGYEYFTYNGGEYVNTRAEIKLLQ